ncbi:MAG: peptide chain release factor-like protein [Candidatus Omnitrophica bacterium]|nr:peptide chain release factor-like protein [Candidatus Omnitrophota bacterium]
MPTGMISPGPQRALEAWMQRLGVQERDLEESFVRSSGPGGQRANKTSTCVVLRHRPSGLEVRCQQERSQALNRVLARRLLLARLDAKRRLERRAETQRRAMMQRQRRRRPQAVKERLLAAKKLHARKKALRRIPCIDQ